MPHTAKPSPAQGIYAGPESFRNKESLDSDFPLFPALLPRNGSRTPYGSFLR